MSRNDDGPDYTALVGRLRRHFRTGSTLSAGYRKQQLQALTRCLDEQKETFLEALWKDLHKCKFEAVTTELGMAAAEVQGALRNLDAWMAPEKRDTPLAMLPGKSFVHNDPQGVVLIIAPFNYPLQLSICPLAGAIAAGNCAVLKPSEMSAHFSRAVAEQLPRYLDRAAFAVVEGAVPETQALLTQRWDHIFFTGSERVGRIVMQAAAPTLTRVTLELGGKSPVLVDSRFHDLRLAARRVMWGKMLNAGQSCVAPDYVLVEEAVHDAFVAALCAEAERLLGGDSQACPHYARIVTTGHAERLAGMIDALSESESCTVAFGGAHDASQRFVEPCVVTGVGPQDAVMEEEIFGPVLPVLKIPSMEAAIDFVNERPHPLALYLFSNDKGLQRRVVHCTTSGGVTVNDTMIQVANEHLPFGGTGTSGMGAYHGKDSFTCFSHRKSVMVRSSSALLDAPQRYPPYSDTNLALIARLQALPLTKQRLATALWVTVALAACVLLAVYVPLLA